MQWHICSLYCEAITDMSAPILQSQRTVPGACMHAGLDTIAAWCLTSTAMFQVGGGTSLLRGMTSCQIGRLRQNVKKARSVSGLRHRMWLTCCTSLMLGRWNWMLWLPQRSATLGSLLHSIHRFDAALLPCCAIAGCMSLNAGTAELNGMAVTMLSSTLGHCALHHAQQNPL